MLRWINQGRQPKSIDLYQDYAEVTTFPKPTAEVRCAQYSANGAYFAYTQPTHVTVVSTADGTSNDAVAAQIDIKETYDMQFSPDGRFLALWTRPVLLDRESGVWSDNVFIYDIDTQAVLTQWLNKQQGGWQPQFTQNGGVMAKNFNNREIHFYEMGASLDIKKPSYKFRLSEGTFQNFRLSPGLNPYVAVFIPEKGGKPAEVRIYNIPNFAQPVCARSFFKAEKCQLQWNALGTALLALALTDHDSSNKSYYGETNLYLLGIAGLYERIDLKREGPIHDITWSPLAREFAVSYGYMPSETTFFDARGNLIHSLATAPRNTILYSPHGRYVLVAGFGNLQGTVDVYDRQAKFAKVCTFEASNTSVCEWLPCGRFILTATTSPRLRVDNGLKIWHASGLLVYYKEYPELFLIAWKPQGIEKFPALKQLEPCPTSHASATEYLAKKAAGSTAVKKTGAYRPPHARTSGAATALTSLYQKELQSGLQKVAAYVPGSKRVVPGAQPAEPKESKTAAKNRKKREAKKAEDASPAPSGTPLAETPDSGSMGSVVGGVVSAEEKKIRSLLKKLRAIEALRMRQAGGEVLEETQINKINKEDEIRLELALLGWSE
ncbi:hypothetical protein HF325_002963 [Metschnikowia pulcherrima]|uniref:Eukaryotic translation initiation factor 2A n=1 Tax=Metschnikowia pulcherrima TaxID=27326 RepID=A0A8H7GRG9_9ASCO|nr:hypothetical protein HF325_002963 [Metschnikowia pulcherrima]